MPRRWGVAVSGCLVLLAGCASSTATRPASIASQVPVGVSAVRVSSVGQVFADQSGGALGPLPAGVELAMSAEQVRRSLLRDGASAQWLTDPSALTVKVGLYYALVPGSSVPGTSASPGPSGIATYVFSGGTGPCPLSLGGVGSPAPGASQAQTCAGVVIADANSGRSVNVQVGPA